MTEHLPECPKAGTKPTLYYFGIPLTKSNLTCICDALRACEQRVGRSLWQECYDAAMQTTERNYVWHEKRGYAAALDAAEAAVEAALNTGLSSSSDNALYFYELDEDDPTLGYNVTFPKGSLIAAIRALREEK